MSAAKKASTAKSRDYEPASLSENVRDAMQRYFRDLDGHDPGDLYDLVIAQVEKPLFEIVIKESRGNLSKAAQLLGMNRGTLRNRLKKYGLAQ